MANKTARNPIDLKAQIDQIAGDEPAPAAPEPTAAATPAAAVAAAPAPAAAREARPGGDTSPANALAAAPAARKREGKPHRGPHITVRLDEELHNRVKKMAADVERSVENMMRRILRRAVAEHEANSDKRDKHSLV